MHVDSGSVTIEHSARPGATVTSSSTRAWRSPSDQEHLSGGTLAIRSSCGSQVLNTNCTRNYVVRLQPTVSLLVVTGQGDVDISGVQGRLDLKSGQGDITVTGRHGAMTASTGQGSISASALGSGPTTVESGQGDVDLRFLTPPTRVSATSGQGSVSIEVPRGFDSYQVHASSGQGSVTNRVNESPTSARIVRATSGQGDVDISY